MNKDVYSRLEDMTLTFTTYENRNNPHVTIHCEGCKQIAKHGGEHKYGQGNYKNHSTYLEAESYAKGTNLPLLICSFCNPPNCG